MAEDSGLERTESASERRREQAREEGQVARSRELSTLALLLAGGGGLWFMGTALADKLSLLMRHGMQLDRALAFDTDLMRLRLKESSVDVLLAFSPLPCARDAFNSDSYVALAQFQPSIFARPLKSIYSALGAERMPGRQGGTALRLGAVRT